MKNVLCGMYDVYCFENVCHAECRETCTPARSDVNPCPSPALCAMLQFAPNDPIEGRCTMRPIECDSVETCPEYLPPLSSGGTGEWKCEEGVCAYPEFEYATR